MKAPSDRHFIHGAIFVLANRMQATGDRQIGDITSKQWLLLVAIKTSSEKMPNITSLAKDLGSSRQNVTVMLGSLERRGYVELRVAQDDRRSQWVALTPKAGVRMAQVSQLGERYINRLLAGVSDEQVAAVVEVFHRMLANLEKMEEEPHEQSKKDR